MAIYIICLCLFTLPTPDIMTDAPALDLLVLGAGWSSSFIIPLCIECGISYAATSRNGTTPNTIKFNFDPAANDPEPFTALPIAQTVLITFPITAPGGAPNLVALYNQTHPRTTPTSFILLGTSSIFRL
jgi:hypothetical protein